MSRRRKNEDMPVFDSVLLRPRVVIHAYTKADLGLPMVQIAIANEPHSLTVDHAERIANGLLAAVAAAARGGRNMSPKIVAVLESMWDWRQMTSGAGYAEAPRFFRINPENFSGKRLYRIVGPDADLYVTNACRELCASANHHGTPNPGWLAENLALLAPFDVLLVCGKIAQATYARTGHAFPRMLAFPHPAARMWTHAMLDAATAQVRQLALGGDKK